MIDSLLNSHSMSREEIRLGLLAAAVEVLDFLLLG